jgi:hypothetical protein
MRGTNLTIFLLLFFTIVFHANGQLRKAGKQKLVSRHSRGSKAFEFSGGVSGYGLVGTSYYSEFMRDNVYYKIGGGYEFKKASTNTTKYSSLFGDLSVGYTVLNQGSVFVSGIGGITVGLDKLEGIQTTAKVGGGFAGVLGGAEIDWYFANNIVFVINGSQRHILTKENSDRWYLTAGLRFKL